MSGATKSGNIFQQILYGKALFKEAAHKKLRDGEVDACSYLEDFVHRCGDGLAECMSEKAVE